MTYYYMRMTQNYLLILKNLRADARKSFTNISKDTGIPVTTVFDNYHKLAKNEVITKHTALIDFKRLGFYFRNFVFIKVRNKDELLSYLKDHENVNSVFKMNTYDYLIDAVFPGIREFYLFIDDLRDFNIINLELHDVIEHIKKEEFFCE